MKLSGNMLSEKGNIKPAARKAVMDSITANPAILGTATPVEGKANVYTLNVEDSEGHTAYVNIDLSVSTIYPTDRAEKKPAKKVAKEVETFDIAD